MPKAMTAQAIQLQANVSIAAARVRAASDAKVIVATIDEKVGVAVAGDLTSNPYVAAVLGDINTRLAEIEAALP